MLAHLEDAAALHDVVIHQHVVAKELDIVREVVEQAANKRRQVNDMGGAVAPEDSLRLLHVSVVIAIAWQRGQ